MKKVPWLKLQVEHGESSWFGFGLVVDKDAPLPRDELMQILSNIGVDVRPVVTGNFTRQPVLGRNTTRDFGCAGKRRYAS